MCSGIKILGIILFFMGLGIILGIIIPVSRFVLAVVFIGVGLAIIMSD